MGIASQILDQIYKITPISNLLSYKGCLSVKQLEDSAAKEKRKKETSIVKCYTDLDALHFWLYVYVGADKD